MDEDRRKSTLVVGGWPKDSRRKSILKDLHDALKALDLERYLDDSGFCTGPRRSVALLPMPQRSGESAQDHRKHVQGSANFRGG